MGLTIVHKSDLSARKKNPRVALVLAGGAVTGGAYKLGGLKALDDFLVNRKTTDFDIYVGLSAGAFLAAPLAGGVTPPEMLRSLDGTSEDFTYLSPLDFYNPNLAEFARKPIEFLIDLITYVPNAVYDFLTQTPNLVRTLQEPLAQARRRPTLANLIECVRPIVDAVGSAREFPFPLAYLPSGLFDNAPLEKYLRYNIDRRGMTNDFRVLYRLRQVELYIVAMNLDTAERVVFGHDEDTSVTISEAVQASTALPGFYKPARIKGVDYVDGGVRRTANIDVAIEHGADLVICYNPFRPFHNRVVRRYIPERNQYQMEGRPLADQGMLTILNQVLRTLLHSRLQLGIQQYQDDPNFEGDIILLEPGESDLAFFKMAPLNLWAGRSAGAHGYLSVTQAIEAHYELIRQILQSYGVLMTRKEVREGLERLLRTEPSEGPEDVLLRDVPKRNLHVA
ncbi:MAG TPA: patatin-like phospholipase family protein [Candidatus Binatus sp.]|nr:patatin-like phospholipase family protein [Candidatus Binatus sp.]